MKIEKRECNYNPKKIYRLGNMTICSVSPENCPYGQSLKVASFDESPFFRCKCNGKVEQIVNEEALVTQ